MIHRSVCSAFVFWCVIVTIAPFGFSQEKPITIGLIGDSTVATTYGWGPAFEKRFNDHTKVLHFAKNGATLESLSKKLDELLELKPDYVLIQFGHNDQKQYDTVVYRNKLTSYVQRVTKAGSKAIVVSSVTRRNFGEDGKIKLTQEGVKDNLSRYAETAKAVAEEQGVPFVDLYHVSVEHHNKIGPQSTAVYDFNKKDQTHFSKVGAAAIADLIVNELKIVVPEITAHTGSLSAVDSQSVAVADDRLPHLYLIGDSTVKAGSGKGDGGLWGWGQVIGHHFDPQKIRVVNRALGGRSSRTFLTEGLWDKVLAEIKPGDFVMMQFGHNDGGERFIGSRPRASIKGIGDEAEDGVVENTGASETVHSYGWYLRKYIADAQQRGATAIVLSPIPRNIWDDGRVGRAAKDYGGWARQTAEAQQAFFIDLNELVAQRYEADGRDVVGRDYFTSTDHTHTTKRGAEVNAQCVVQGVRSHPACPLAKMLLDNER